MIPIFNKESRRTPTNPYGGPPLELNSDFGSLEGDALELMQRRYGDRGLAVSRERFSSRNEAGDIVCTANDGDKIIGTLAVRFDGAGGLNADTLFKEEMAEWRAAGVTLCEFGALAVDKHSHEPKRVLAQIFHLGYLHAHRRARVQRLVIEVNPRHVAFYRRWLGLLPYTTARHNPRVNAPAVLMSFDFATAREQIALLGGKPELMATERCLYPLFWGSEAEAAMLAKLPLS
ncbi:long-chain N-acyl amino acid synthase [Roseateles sp. BYS78W]|uniref:Long-chain N-acyl amino acid synthase n=1 Tax=Pelomonas candidula TaxID=3299025 RepID=A0ABW7HKS8_9BURK